MYLQLFIVKKCKNSNKEKRGAFFFLRLSALSEKISHIQLRTKLTSFYITSVVMMNYPLQFIYNFLKVIILETILFDLKARACYLCIHQERPLFWRQLWRQDVFRPP